MTPSVSGPADLVAAVPHLLGFHPSDSLVAIGISGNAIGFAARIDAPPGPSGPSVAEAVAAFAVAISRQHPDEVVLVGYGSPGLVEPALLALEDAMHFPVRDILVVTDGRFRSSRCDNPDCCPPEGLPFEVSTGPAVFPDRDALVATIAPVEGAAREAMLLATTRARDRLARLDTARAVLAMGDAALRSALRRHRAGRELSDDRVAWLSVLVGKPEVQDRVLTAVSDPELHTTLWAEVVRRAAPELVADPAGLLAFAAWRAGNGALASIAVARALEVDPENSLAMLMDDLITSATPPAMRRRRALTRAAGQEVTRCSPV